MPIQFDELKAYVYGIGRGFGIKVTPRHHQGELAQQVLSLAADIVAADTWPSNVDLGSDAAAAFQTLQNALAEKLPGHEIERHIRNYIQERIRALSKGSVK